MRNRFARRVFILAIGMVISLGLMLTIVRSGIAGSMSQEHENEAIVYRGSTACGVERWSVKTGMDRDAKKVNLNRVVSTNIIHLRSLTAPSVLPNTSRIAPTELTTFGVSAFLLRFKEEQDSDYHLVLADAGGRTMIAEIPAPDCVGKSSAFLSKIQDARSQFDRRYKVADFWQRLREPVTVTGVGFFDFKHGQSGVAPNAIELHPVLSIIFGKAAQTTTGAGTRRPAASPTASGKGFSVTAWVKPNPMSHNAHPTLYARTTPGASCTATVAYSTGRPLRSFNGSARTAGSSGTVSWTWHEETTGSGGTGRVTCTYRGQTKTATTSFTVG